MLNTDFSPWPSFSQEEAEAVSSVLLSNKVNYWTGEQGRNFESEFAEWVGAKHAVALGNGTQALDIALKALGVGLGDEVITTSRTFLATVSSIVNAQATPVFADVDLNSQNITADTIKRSITTKTKAIIVVHLAGFPAEMDPIMQLAKEHDIYVIEDCAQAHGAKYKGVSVGTIGHIGCWSFCQDKIMTTGGEGGMVTTNSESLWKKMWSYKDHGKSYDAVHQKSHPEGFRWLHESFGTNFRMTEMQAVIGRIQLKKVDEWVSIRQSHAKVLESAVKDLPFVRIPYIPEYIVHSFYRFYLFLNQQHLKQGWSRDRVIREIQSHNVPAYHGSCSEVYLEKAFENTNFRPKHRLVNAKKLGEDSIMFLVHPSLSGVEVEHMASVLRETLLRCRA